MFNGSCDEYTSGKVAYFWIVAGILLLPAGLSADVKVTAPTKPWHVTEITATKSAMRFDNHVFVLGVVETRLHHLESEDSSSNMETLCCEHEE